jgi:glycosyltransferase involved in cell wall biosynthesis
VFLADCVGIPSKTADQYVLNYSRRIHLLKSGLDTRVFNPQPTRSNHANQSQATKLIETPVGESDLVFKNIRDYTGANTVMVYAGRLAPEKNIEFLISALAHESMKHFSFVIVGDGPCRNALEKLAVQVVGQQGVMNERDIKTSTASVAPKRVVFTGMILDEYQVATFYSQCDVFVSASASETFGFTVAEAMACGTPAVVVRSGAFKTVYKMIDDWMFNEHDQLDFIDKLATATRKKSNRKLARDIAVKGFSVDQAIDDFLAIYKQIIDGNFVSQI